MTLKEIYQKAKQQNRTNVMRFMRDMKNAGIKMRHYYGRFFYEGPAVVGDLDEILQATRAKCQWDRMGLEYVVYPR
jgi:hypothetical protein